MKTRRSSKLRTRMTLSYMLVSVAAVLSLETLLAIVAFFVIVFSPALDNAELTNAKRIARSYAQIVGNQTGTGASFAPHTIFDSSASSTLNSTGANRNNFDVENTVPYIASSYSGPEPAPFALIIAPDGSVLASSYPSRYPAHMPAIRLLPTHSSLIVRVLKGEEGESIEWATTGRVGAVIVPIWNKNRHVIGAVYVQLPPEVSINDFVSSFAFGFLLTGLITLLFAAPTGALFGLITTRGLVRRVQLLVEATTQFASGHFEQRVTVKSNDEAGQLEHQFNLMAEQLVESIEQRQTLTEQNARLAERARISRDLHDSVKQQMFALTMQVSTALTLLDTQPEAVRSHLSESEKLSHQVQQELTTLILSLRPSALTEKGLAVVLRDYVTGWSSQQHIPVQLYIDTCVLPPPVEEALLRIAQEALSNVARHSHASSVELHLSCEDGQVVLSIEDNGCGFDVGHSKQLAGNGVGLHSMRERIEALQGTCCVESTCGQGTLVKANIPM